MWVNFIGFGIFLVSAALVRQFDGISSPHAALLLLSSLAVPLILMELLGRRVYRNASSGIDFTAKANIDWKRVAIKLFGYYFTLGIIALLYWLLPVYHKAFYFPFWAALKIVLPVFVVGAIPYFAWVDRYQTRPRDGYWQFGMLLLGRSSSDARPVLAQYALSWLVKAFFLPLMFAYFSSSVNFFRHVEMARIWVDPGYGYRFLWEMFYTIDLVFVVVGYSLTLRMLDSHIRSADPTVSGWGITLICYEPFWTAVAAAYFAYNMDHYSWGNWLADSPTLYVIWGVVILVITGIYASCSVAFGLRFSNLTHRGIITNGPYRYCKHPAYVAKNISWWLIAIPFITDSGVVETLRDCALLLGVNLIYFVRARTEERHLSWDPVYVEYAMAMNQRSIFSALARRVPFLQYRQPGPTSLGDSVLYASQQNNIR